MLRVNPDVQTVWNMRREGLPEDWSAEEELALSADGIRKNPKSYGAWHHRVWVLAQRKVDLHRELDLCGLLLKQDARNFHCWNYRRHVASLLGREQETAELAFAAARIAENFSNYSAFHHRSVYIKGAGSARELAEAELALTESAVFTEPDDQSAWWYRRFVYSWCEEQTLSEPVTVNWLKELYRTQRLAMTSLLEVEPESRWTLQELIYLCGRVGKLEESGEESDCLAEREGYLDKLTELDPMHRRRYEYLRSQTSRKLGGGSQ